MLASLIAAVVAALCYGVASVMQAVAVRDASNRAPASAGPQAGVDPGLLPRMLLQWRFVASIAIDTLGFIAQLVALRRLPLFAVQAMVAANLAVIAVLGTLVIGITLSWREWLAVTGVVAGVGLLGSSAGAEGASQAGLVFKVALLAASAGLAVCGIAAARLPDPARTLLLGTIAGFGYGVLGIAARVLNGFEPLTLLRDPAAYTVVAAGIVSFVFYATALEGGRVTVATAAVVLAETLPPAVIGVAFLGDKTRPGLEPVAIVGFVLAVASAVMLAKFGEAEHPDEHPAQCPDDHQAGNPAANPVLRSDLIQDYQVVRVRRVILVARGPAALRRHFFDHGSPSWPLQRLSPDQPHRGRLRPSISLLPAVSPRASARASPRPVSAVCSRCAGCGSRCRNLTRT
jgi:drug/metabolite transporter (DMT)-like permease